MPDPDDVDPDDVDPDDIDPGDVDPDDEPYVAPTAEEWLKAQRKIERQEERITRLVGKGKGGGADVDRQLARQIKGKLSDLEDDEPADTAEADRWKGIAIQNAASAQIAAAGFSGTAAQAVKLARLLDMSEIEPNRDGAFDLEDEVQKLVEEYPQLFAKPQGRRSPAVRRSDSDQTAPKKSPTDRTSEALMRQAGYR
jgi:hypothetical protein